jgi:hypothetical protein
MIPLLKAGRNERVANKFDLMHFWARVSTRGDLSSQTVRRDAYAGSRCGVHEEHYW